MNRFLFWSLVALTCLVAVVLIAPWVVLQGDRQALSWPDNELSRQHPDGAYLTYATFGCHAESGKPLVVVHGRASNGSQFWTEAEWFGRQGKCVITIDLRGHNGNVSVDQSNPADWTIEAMTHDLHWLLVEQLGHQSFDLYGHSLGAVVSMEYIETHPDTVDNLIVSGAHLEIKSIDPGLIALDRVMREKSGDGYLHAVVQYWSWLWVDSGDAARALNQVQQLGGGYDAARDLLIINQIPVYDYREAISSFEEGGGHMWMIYPDNDRLINSGMEPSLAFMRELGVDRTHVVPGGHYGHLADSSRLTEPLWNIIMN